MLWKLGAGLNWIRPPQQDTNLLDLTAIKRQSEQNMISQKFAEYYDPFFRCAWSWRYVSTAAENAANREEFTLEALWRIAR